MLALPNVTLVCFENRDNRKAAALLDAMCAMADFGGVRWSNAHRNYSEFERAEFEIWKTVWTDFILTIHLDGFILNPEAWDPTFLRYDYVGAPWPEHHLTNIDPTWTYRMGNSGFSLRSRELCKRASDYRWKHGAFDITVCQIMRKQFEDEGFRFAPIELAENFSQEILHVDHPTFGFHGRWPGSDDAPWYYHSNK